MLCCRTNVLKHLVMTGLSTKTQSSLRLPIAGFLGRGIIVAHLRHGETMDVDRDRLKKLWRPLRAVQPSPSKPFL